MCSTWRSVSDKEASLDAEKTASLLTLQEGLLNLSYEHPLQQMFPAVGHCRPAWHPQQQPKPSHSALISSALCHPPATPRNGEGGGEDRLSAGIFFSAELCFPREAIQLLWEDSTEIPTIRAHNCHSVREIHSIPSWNQAAYSPANQVLPLSVPAHGFWHFCHATTKDHDKYCIGPAPMWYLAPKHTQFKVTTQTKAGPQKRKTKKPHNLLISAVLFPMSQQSFFFFFLLQILLTREIWARMKIGKKRWLCRSLL